MHVIPGHVGQEGDHGAVVLRAVGLERVVGGGDRAAEASPEIDFPSQVQARVHTLSRDRGHQHKGSRAGHSARLKGAAVGRESADNRAGHRVGLRIGAAVDPFLVAGRGGLRLGEEVPIGDPQLGAGLKNAIARLAERQVLTAGAVDEAIERRVLEYGPPSGEVGRLLADSRVGGVDPMVFHTGRRALVVRPHLEAVAQVLHRAGASVQKEGRRHRSPSGHAETSSARHLSSFPIGMRGRRHICQHLLLP